MRTFPYLYQINCSPGGLPKLPMHEATVSVEGIKGDRQRNRVLHGGPDRALCVFSLEILSALQQEGHNVYAGASGENLTLAGLNWMLMKPGDRLKIGNDVHIELTSFCEPCRHNAQWFVGGNYHRISHHLHPGWSRVYARVLAGGKIRKGDRVWVEMLSGRALT